MPKQAPASPSGDSDSPDDSDDQGSDSSEYEAEDKTEDSDATSSVESDEDGESDSEDSESHPKLGSADFRAALNPDEEELMISSYRWCKDDGCPDAHLHDLSAVVQLIQRAQIPDDEVLYQGAIDSGTFSTIERARWRGQEVAIKVINRSSFGTENNQMSATIHQLLRSTMLELGILQGLSHPNVCAYLGTIARFPPGEVMKVGMVFEMKKCNLWSRLHRSPAQSEMHMSTRVQVLKDICSGLNYLHAACILHRDLSSRNILLDAQDRACITDFGFARRVDKVVGYRTTTISGSPEYMPIEQFKGESLTLKVDVFAFGTLMWEICANRQPRSSAAGEFAKVRDLVLSGTRLPLLGTGTFTALKTGKASLLRERFDSLVRRATNGYAAARPSMMQMQEMLDGAFDEGWEGAVWERGRADFEQRLLAVYEKLNPDNTSNTFLLSEEWNGAEHKLMHALATRYKIKWEGTRLDVKYLTLMDSSSDSDELAGLPGAGEQGGAQGSASLKEGNAIADEGGRDTDKINGGHRFGNGSGAKDGAARFTNGGQARGNMQTRVIRLPKRKTESKRS